MTREAPQAFFCQRTFSAEVEDTLGEFFADFLILIVYRGFLITCDGFLMVLEELSQRSTFSV